MSDFLDQANRKEVTLGCAAVALHGLLCRSMLVQNPADPTGPWIQTPFATLVDQAFEVATLFIRQAEALP